MRLRPILQSLAILLTLAGQSALGQTPAAAPKTETAPAAAEGGAVQLPEAFSLVDPADLIRALYEKYDPKTGLLGKTVTSADGKKLAGQLYDAAMWKGATEPSLLVMVETYVPEDGKRPEAAATDYGLDLAAFTLKDGKLNLIAQLKNAETHSGHSQMNFDQAPYRVTDDLRAFGLRESYLHSGLEVSRLHLFVLDGQTFHSIFEREMSSSNTSDSGDTLEGDLSTDEMKTLYSQGAALTYQRSAVLVVVPHEGAANEFKVTERSTERKEDGTVAKATAVEHWTWDEAKGVYVKGDEPQAP